MHALLKLLRQRRNLRLCYGCSGNNEKKKPGLQLESHQNPEAGAQVLCGHASMY